MVSAYRTQSSLDSSHSDGEGTIFPLPAVRRVSQLSYCSSDSASNLVSPGDFTETPRQELPTFLPNGSQPASSTRFVQTFPRWSTIFYGWRVAFGSWLNVLLVLIPISWTMTLTVKNSHGLTFSFCILALIPLVRLHDLATRELANRVGGSKAGLLNGSMNNFVEVVVAISALRKCELKVVQSTLIGAMLCKLLLVQGLCFFAGGIQFSEQGFDPTATQIHSSLLSLSVGAVLLPAAYHFTLGNPGDAPFEAQKKDILHMSHGVSIVLLFIYISYLLFQLWSHSYLYKDQHDKKSNRLSTVIRAKREKRRLKHEPNPLSGPSNETDIPRATTHTILIDPPSRPFLTVPLHSSSDITLASRSESALEAGLYFPNVSQSERISHERPGIPMSRNSSMTSSAFSDASSSMPYKGERSGTSPSLPVAKNPQLSWFLTTFLLIVVTGAVAVTVDWLVEAMDEISTTISKEWVGLILLPAVGSVAGMTFLISICVASRIDPDNNAEIITAVKVSVKDEITLSVSVAVGSTIQTALLVIPFTVILGWITSKPLSLLMDPFQSMVLFIAVHTMGYVVADGKSNWLEGVILICLYVIIAVSFWFYPASTIDLSSTCIPSR